VEEKVGKGTWTGRKKKLRAKKVSLFVKEGVHSNVADQKGGEGVKKAFAAGV